MGQIEAENEVQRLETRFCGLMQEPMTQFEQSSKAELRLQSKDTCEGHNIQIALAESAPYGIWSDDCQVTEWMTGAARPQTTLTPSTALGDANATDQEENEGTVTEEEEDNENPGVYLVNEEGGLTPLSQL
jgi:hypothetical protein